MQVKDFLSVVTEHHMRAFFEREIGVEVESVIKFYDEAYGGYLFQVKLNGLNFLPKEDNGFMRFGKFGLVKDDLNNPLPTTYDNFEDMLNNSNFFKSYVMFINNLNRNLKVYNETYIESLNKALSYFINMQRLIKQKKIEEEYKKRKQYLNSLVETVKEIEKE